MKKILSTLLVFFFCFSTTSLSQYQEKINYSKRYEIINSIIPDFQVNENQGNAGQFDPRISTDGNGNFVITWTDFRYGISDISAQRYTSDGTVLGTNFKVNDDQGSGDQWYSSISTDGNGNFVITWQDKRNVDWDIYARRFSSNGTALGMDFKVNDDQGSKDQLSPSISLDGSGNFVIIWEDERDGDPDIYAQRYSLNGGALGSNFRVANTSEREQKDPDVNLWNGWFYNTWEDNRFDGSDNDIWANVLDWENPNAVGDEELSQLPSSFNLSQNYPNPFNPTTKINYAVPQSSIVVIKVFDVLGNEIETLINDEKTAGTYELTWIADNLPSGIYFYKLQAGSFVETKKMVLMK